MVGIIVTGHGHFGTGIESSVHLIAGKPEKFVAVDFPEGDTPDNLAKQYNAAIDSFNDCEGVIIFSDLAGGSPFKTAVEVKMQRKEKIEVLAGTNLGMILEIATARTFMDDMEAITNMAVSTGKDQVIRFVLAERNDEPSEGDGI